MRCAGVIALALALLGAPACGSCKKEEGTPDAAPVAVGAPVPPPPNLLADVVVATPNPLWSRLQRGVGGALGLMPSSFGGVVCVLAGLDVSIGDEVDGAAPAFAALTDESDHVAFAIAMKLADQRHAERILIEGETARYTTRDLAGMKLLAAKTQMPMPLAVALAPGGYLVAASSERDLERIGPYAYRTLPTRPTPKSPMEVVVARAAIATEVEARARAKWGELKVWLVEQDDESQRKHGGRAPDFGDAKALLAAVDAFVQRRLALLSNLDEVRVSIDAGEDAVQLEARLVPAKGGGVATDALAAMHPGDAAPLTSAPLDASIALLVRDDAADRAADARELDASLTRVLGARLGEEDNKKLRAALDDWARGRGDWVTASLGGGASRAVVVHAPVVNAELASRAVREGLELLQRPVFHDPLKSTLALRDVSFSAIDVPGIGHAHLASLAREGGAPPLGVAWVALPASQDLYLAASEAAPQLLASTVAAPAKLGDDKLVGRALRGVGSRATLVLVAQPLRFDPTRGASAQNASVVLAWGKQEADVWARVELSDALVREAIRVSF